MFFLIIEDWISVLTLITCAELEEQQEKKLDDLLDEANKSISTFSLFSTTFVNNSFGFDVITKYGSDPPFKS